MSYLTTAESKNPQLDQKNSSFEIFDINDSVLSGNFGPISVLTSQGNFNVEKINSLVFDKS